MRPSPASCYNSVPPRGPGLAAFPCTRFSFGLSVVPAGTGLPGRVRVCLFFAPWLNTLLERLIAIGDVHGCAKALRGLLSAIAPKPRDTLVFLGDLIDRGPDSRGVIELVLKLQKLTRVVVIKGNHEEMMEAVLNRQMEHSVWLKYGGLSTLDSYGFNGDRDFLPPTHVAFFKTLVDYFEQDDFFFAHASYDPDLPLAVQPWADLRWISLREVVPSPHFSGKLAVVGHTANPEGNCVDFGHLLCIDTGCYGGGFLTAVDVRRRVAWQVDPEGNPR